MSGGTSTKHSGRRIQKFWFSYNQKFGGRAIPELPGTDNLQSLHIINPSEDTEV